MLRLILLSIVVLFIITGVLAVVLFHFFGWTGLLVFPFIVIALLWLVKIIVKSLFKKIALGLFGMKAGVLKGATMTVHSIKSVPKPPDPEPEPDEDDGPDETDPETAADEEQDEKPGEPEEVKDYVELDATITPRQGNCEAVWEPSELILTSDKIKNLTDLEEKEVGTTHSVEIWNGTAFGPDDPGKYPGEQRLKIIFEVKPGTTGAWLHYYNQSIGQLKLPAGTIDV